MIVGILLIGCVSMYYFVTGFLSGDAPVVLKIGIPTIAIVGVRFVTSMVLSGAAELLVYGTAVEAE